MTEVISPALSRLIGLMCDPDLRIATRVEAARAIIEHECPIEVFDLTREFLLLVADGEENGSWVLKALTLVRKVEAKRVVPGTTGALDTAAAQALGLRVAKARRRTALCTSGEWPAPPGWDSDIVPIKVSVSLGGVAERLEQARVAAMRADREAGGMAFQPG